MTQRFDKSKLPSRYVSVGVESAPHRSYYYAMGLTEEEIARPFVGIASAGNDSAPCNTTLDQQADWCRQGVNAGGGMPRRFNTITVTDAQLVGAMRFFAERMKIVVEPTGALALAGALHGGCDVHGARVGIVISGGNVDLPRYARFLSD